MWAMADDQKPEKASSRREYVPPKLERLGTIRDLTYGLGSMTIMDGGHPPGQNKSLGR
jgi:hypothetical protein